MPTSIRNIDEKLFKRFKIEAKKRDLNIGEAVNQAMLSWMLVKREGKLGDIEPWDFGPGTENLSQEIDDILYG